MGQELLDKVGYIKKPRKYYLATNSKGHMVVRGTTQKEYTHATIYGELYNSGYCYATFTTRLDLAKRYSRRWDKSEVVEVKELPRNELKKYKNLILERAKLHQEIIAKGIAKVYEIDREANDNQA